MASAAPPVPKGLAARVGIDQRIGASLPADVRLSDAFGRTATWSEWLHNTPAILMVGYFTCPNLCDVTQQGLLSSLSKSGLKAGQDVNVIFMSIDPAETSASAHKAQDRMSTMGAGNTQAWHYLFGAQDAIKKTTDAVGYRYWYDATLHQYAHPSGIIVLTPQGTVSQYLMGVSYPPQTLRLAVIAASHYTLGNVVDQLVLFCCGYDPSTGRYTVTIDRIMKIAGSLFLILLLFAIARLWRAHHQRST